MTSLHGRIHILHRVSHERSYSKVIKNLQKMVPEQYWDFAHVFSEDEFQQLSEYKSWDYAIELVSEAKTFHAKIYPLAKNEQEELDKFLNENLRKGYIWVSKLPMASPFFFVKKKDGRLRLVQDYCQLNKMTIKNQYPLPLISKLMDHLKGTKHFTKFDVCWEYNNVWIKKGDEHKAAFVTNRELFKPTVMFFGLTNLPTMFQNIINDIFADLITEGKVTVYLINILIFFKDLDGHCHVIQKVLRCLREHDLFLNLSKCKFKQPQVEYLGLIIAHNKIRMDPIKVKAISKWPTPQNPSDVRQFCGFANFYWRFIKDFGKICKPLNWLTDKEPWKWGNNEQTAFEELKRKFASSLVLSMWDFDLSAWMETDASGFATGGVLEQKHTDNVWHLVAYLLEGMTEMEHNYKIYNRELLAVVRALETWHHYLEGLLEKFTIFTDYKNLEYWRTARNLTRQQACWSLFLSWFNFEIVPCPGKTMGKLNALSRSGQHELKNKEDNHNQVILGPDWMRVLTAWRGHAQVVADKYLIKQICTCSDKAKEVAEALQKVQKLRPRLLSKGLDK